MSISTEIARLQQAKSDLATSITNKGVTVPASATLDDYPALVDQIQTGGGSLPYDAEVEYLHSDGSGQYIDTGIAYNSTVVVVGSVQLATTAAWNYIFGIVTVVGSTTQRWSVNGGTSSTNVAAHFGTITNVTASFSRGVFHNIMANYRYLTVDGVPADTKASAFTPSNDVNIFLFCRNNEGTPEAFRNCDFGYFKIFKGGSLVRDYIPVRVGTVGYMYDKVSKTLFGNAGNGSFTLGPDVT